MSGFFGRCCCVNFACTSNKKRLVSVEHFEFLGLDTDATGKLENIDVPTLLMIEYVLYPSTFNIKRQTLQFAPVVILAINLDT